MSCPRFHMGHMTGNCVKSVLSPSIAGALKHLQVHMCTPLTCSLWDRTGLGAFCLQEPLLLPAGNWGEMIKPCFHFLISAASWESAFYETTIIYTITQECPGRELTCLRGTLNPLLKAAQQQMCMWTSVHHTGTSDTRDCHQILYSRLYCPSLTYHWDVKSESSRLVL